MLNDSKFSTTTTADICSKTNISSEYQTTHEHERATQSEIIDLPNLDDLSDCLTDIKENSLLDTQDINFVQSQTLDNLLSDIHGSQVDSNQLEFNGTNITVVDGISSEELDYSQKAMLQDIIGRAESKDELIQQLIKD